MKNKLIYIHVQKIKLLKIYMGKKMENIDIKLNSYLNKIENNNFPHEEAKY